MHVSSLPPVGRLVTYILGLLGFCSAVTFLHPRLRRPESRAIRQAVNSWWPTALLGCAVALCGVWLAVPLFAALSAWTLREYLRMLPDTDQHPFLHALAYAAIPLHYAALCSGRPLLFFGVVLLWTFGVLPLAAGAHRGPEVYLHTVPRLQLGVILTVLSLSHCAWLFFQPPLVAAQPAGPGGLIALLLVGVMVGDAFQYFFGKLLGRHLLAPRLSPKKTWEGLIGGMLAAGLAAMAAAPLVTPLSRLAGAAVGAALCLLGLCGDLLISGIKRSAQVKDTGAVLPGQGGVLDRCDSLLLTAPLFVYGMAAWLS